MELQKAVSLMQRFQRVFPYSKQECAVQSLVNDISLSRFWNFNEVPGRSPALFSSAKTTLGLAADIPNPEWVVATFVLLIHSIIMY